ncbi:MAG: hypothetical protein R2770_04670 [Acidimicrobiales bacterium]
MAYQERPVVGQPHPLELRGLLTFLIHARGGVTTIADLVDELDAAGVKTARPASQQISDSLRAEVSRGRVVRVARGRYRPGHIPRTTRQRIDARARRALIIGAQARSAEMVRDPQSVLGPTPTAAEVEQFNSLRLEDDLSHRKLSETQAAARRAFLIRLNRGC